MKRDCHEAMELLDRTRRCELGQSERNRLDAHLAGCALCREARDDQAFAEGALATLPEVAYDTERAARAIRAETAVTGGRGFAWRYALVGAGIVAAATVLALVVTPSTERDNGLARPARLIAMDVEAEAVVVTPDEAEPQPELDEETVVAEPEPEPEKPRPVRKRRPHRPRNRMASRPTPEPVDESPEPVPQPEEPEEGPKEPDLSIFFALGPPKPPPIEPELVVETSEVVGADGSVMMVESMTDLRTGERVARVIAVYESPGLTAEKARDGEEGAGDEAGTRNETVDPQRSGYLLRGGELG